MLSCRYVMLQNSILIKPKWGTQAVVRGGTAPLGPTVATSLATSTKKNTTVINLVNSRLKTTKPYCEQELPNRT